MCYLLRLYLSIVVYLIVALDVGDAYVSIRRTNSIIDLAIRNRSSRFTSRSILVAAKKSDDLAPDVITKASWYAVEAFGNIFKNSSPSETKITTDEPPKSIQETYERIRIDNERYYFLSGTIDELIYSEDCTFADPFVSFTGRDRFVSNLSNLGSFITKYNVRQLEYIINTDDNAVTTKFMVKLQLNLPWQPILAWPWGVRCNIDPETNLIVEHIESVSKILTTLPLKLIHFAFKY
jgi:hypothetical protein